MDSWKRIIPSTLRQSKRVKRIRDFMQALMPPHLGRINKVGFDVVHGCQLRCVGCPNSQLLTKISYISQEDFETCLGNLDVNSLRLLRLFNFGEALLHPNLPDLLTQIPQQTYTIENVEISTNAQHQDWHKLAEIFKVGVITHFMVSCDGDGTPEEYERLRPPAKWERLIEFLAKAKEFQRLYAPNVQLFTRTICETEEGRRRWQEILTPLGWTPLFRKWFFFPNTSQQWDCEIPRRACKHMYATNKLYVDVDGTVVPCCVHPRAFVLGNLKTQTYTQIMRGMTRKIKFLELEFRRKTMGVCGECGIL